MGCNRKPASGFAALKEAGCSRTARQTLRRGCSLRGTQMQGGVQAGLGTLRRRQVGALPAMGRRRPRPCRLPTAHPQTQRAWALACPLALELESHLLPPVLAMTAAVNLCPLISRSCPPVGAPAGDCQDKRVSLGAVTFCRWGCPLPPRSQVRGQLPGHPSWVSGRRAPHRPW